jgi:hypothetical protein
MAQTVFFVTVCHRTATFVNGDALDEYYAFRTREKTKSNVLFVFQQYHPNKQH